MQEEAGIARMATEQALSRGGATEQSSQAREVAEVQAAMVIAKRFPRDIMAAQDRILQACTRASLAEGALYSYSRGGQEISGPSIRLAEVLAQCWGNIDFGVRELSQQNGESVVQAYAWDLETNTRQTKTFTVPHIRYTRQGSRRLEDPRDVYEQVANQAARRLRACVLGVIPGDVQEAAIEQCEVTLSAKADTSGEGISRLLEAFAGFGVTKEQIEKRIQRRIDTIRPAQVVQLKKVYASLRDGMSGPEDWFEQPAATVKADAAAAKIAAARGARPMHGTEGPATGGVKPDAVETPEGQPDSGPRGGERPSDGGGTDPVVDDGPAVGGGEATPQNPGVEGSANLRDVPGLGRSALVTLRKAGLTTPDAILAAGREKIASLQGFGRAKVDAVMEWAYGHRPHDEEVEKPAQEAPERLYRDQGYLDGLYRLGMRRGLSEAAIQAKSEELGSENPLALPDQEWEALASWVQAHKVEPPPEPEPEPSIEEPEVEAAAGDTLSPAKLKLLNDEIEKILKNLHPEQADTWIFAWETWLEQNFSVELEKEIPGSAWGHVLRYLSENRPEEK